MRTVLYKNQIERIVLQELSEKFPNIMPFIKFNQNTYLVSNYTVPSKNSFNTESIYNLFIELNYTLYSYKSHNYSVGIYKYINQEIIDYNKINYKKYIITYLQYLLKIYNLSKKFTDKVNHLENINLIIPNQFSLLHGDLHIGNIVTKKNKFILIDFEFLRYGITEIEISNFIFSLLKNDCVNFNIKEFLRMIKKNFNIDNIIFFNIVIYIIEYIKHIDSPELVKINKIAYLIEKTTANIAYSS